MTEGTRRFPFKGGVLLTNRNRFDMVFTAGNFSWRYRNRLTVQRTYAIRDHHFTPYVREELFFTSTYKKWNNTALSAGIIFPLLKRYEIEPYIEPYYESQNNSGTRPNTQTNALGLRFKLYFRQDR